MCTVGRLGIAFVVALVPVTPVVAQVTVGGASPLVYSQNFDTPTLPSSGSITFVQYDVASPTIPGWFGLRTGTGTTINADTGTNTAGALYNYGSLSLPSDRSLGSIGSNSAGHFAWGVVFQNTGTTTLDVNVQYTGEQWRRGLDATAHTLAFSYLLASSPPPATSVGIPIPTSDGAVPSGYTSVSALNFISPQISGSGTALNGNDAANRVQFNQDVSIGLAAGQYVVFHWSDPNHAGNDHGLSIDDLTFTFASTPVPEPTTVLAIAAAGLGLVSAARRRLRRDGAC